MKKNEFLDELRYFVENQNEISQSVYVLFKNTSIIKRLDIEDDDLTDMQSLFVNFIEDNILSQDDLNVLPLSSSDERVNVIYEFDLELPDEFESIEAVTSNEDIDFFDTRNDDINQIGALMVELGNEERQVILYKSMPAIHFFSRSHFFLKRSPQRFKRVEEDFFRISANFQLLKVSGKYFVLDLKSIEKLFGFHDIIQKNANLGIQTIEDYQILENPAVLKETAKDDIAFARKLTKISRSSPIIRLKINTKAVISFCKEYPKLKDRMRFNSKGDKILLDTKISRNLFIQLMMDDFLVSELTKHHYLSHAKDDIDVDI